MNTEHTPILKAIAQYILSDETTHVREFSITKESLVGKQLEDVYSFVTSICDEYEDDIIKHSNCEYFDVTSITFV